MRLDHVAFRGVIAEVIRALICMVITFDFFLKFSASSEHNFNVDVIPLELRTA